MLSRLFKKELCTRRKGGFARVAPQADLTGKRPRALGAASGEFSMLCCHRKILATDDDDASRPESLFRRPFDSIAPPGAKENGHKMLLISNSKLKSAGLASRRDRQRSEPGATMPKPCGRPGRAKRPLAFSLSAPKAFSLAIPLLRGSKERVEKCPALLGDWFKMGGNTNRGATDEA